MTSFFTNARDVCVNEFKVINVSPPIGDPLNGERSELANMPNSRSIYQVQSQT